MSDDNRNVDTRVTAGFGHEWSTFSQNESEFAAGDRQAIFESYFGIFPWSELPPNAVGIDVGCGSGRWSAMVAPKVGHLHLLDASEDALAVARKNLSGFANTEFHHASVSEIPVPDQSLDFAFSLGVLHHVPDTAAAIGSIARKLKQGAPLLIYLYYSLDNRPWWYRALWGISNVFRVVISRLPAKFRLAISQFIAVIVYWPLARLCLLIERAGFPSESLPLAAYRKLSFYVMRTDAYDRFCTRLEQRFSRVQIEDMLNSAGFDRIVFSDTTPYWCAVGRRR